MSAEDASRRKFLVSSMTGLSAAWIAASWPAIAQTQEHAAIAAGTGHFAFFTPSQAADIDAMASQIFPTTDTPGAREAQVIYFIDLGLMSFARDMQSVYRAGFVELQARLKSMFPAAPSFSALTSTDQIQLLRAIEQTPFFRSVRNHTIMGMFASPQHGGNFNKVGWKLIGFEDNLNFQSPFGYYDR